MTTNGSLLQMINCLLCVLLNTFPIPIHNSYFVMRTCIAQFSCFCPIFECIIVIPFMVAARTHMVHCNWIIRLYSFHHLLYDFFFIFPPGRLLSTEWATRSLEN